MDVEVDAVMSVPAVTSATSSGAAGAGAGTAGGSTGAGADAAAAVPEKEKEPASFRVGNLTRITAGQAKFLAFPEGQRFVPMRRVSCVGGEAT